MKRGIFGIALILMMALSMVLVSCTPQTTPTATPTATSKPTPTSTVEANWWDKFGEPKYGGTLTKRVESTHLSSLPVDPANPAATGAKLWYERLFVPDWTLDRNIFPFTTQWIPPEYYAGQLAESWEQTDPQTITVHIRQGVYWHDKPPVNGREFTAEDVQFNYDRILGTGSGFTEPNPFYSATLPNLERAVATDKYTVEFRFETPSALAVDTLLNNQFGLAAPEWVELYATEIDFGPPPGPPPEGGAPPAGGGDTEVSEEWKTAVGTAPYMLTDFVAATSVTFSRNPNYWGYDERHPQNQLPYVDTYKQVGIEDTTTALAALRTGKIDLVIDQNGPTLQQVQSVAKTNPEIQVGWWSVNGYSVIFRCDTEPFTDINVRKALQLAINCPLIAQTHYSGAVDGTPAGLMHPAFKGWCTPYNEWPEELQEEYSYNPDKSKELLAAAGYPDGFSTNIIAASAWDLDLLQIIQSQFKDIGVDMEIQVYDVPVFSSLVETGQHDQMVYDKHTGMCASPLTNMKFRTQGYSRNPSFNNDPNYDAMFNRLSTASSIDEAKELVKEMDMYALQQHWAVNLFPWLNALMWQPWVKGYSAETTGSCETTYIARIWIDKE